jgi:hypothetical protein
MAGSPKKAGRYSDLMFIIIGMNGYFFCTWSGTAAFRASSSEDEAPEVFPAEEASAAVDAALAAPAAVVLFAVPALLLLLEAALTESPRDKLRLAEMLLLCSVSDSDAAVDADADLLSLAAALALSLELPRWLLLWLSLVLV